MKKQKYDVVWLDYRSRHVIILADYLRTIDLTILVLESIDEAVARLPQIEFNVFGLEIVLPFGLRFIEDIRKGGIPNVSSEIDIMVYTTLINGDVTKKLEPMIGEKNIFFKPEDPEKIALRIKEIIG